MICWALAGGGPAEPGPQLPDDGLRRPGPVLPFLPPTHIKGRFSRGHTAARPTPHRAAPGTQQPAGRRREPGPQPP